MHDDFKCPMLKLPSWDQPAVINWEPLEPPSPYHPAVRSRAYPSVVRDYVRVRSTSGSPERRESSRDVVSAAGLGDSYDALFEEEEAAQNQLFKEESERREDIVFSEQLESTHLWVEVLQCISVMLEMDVQSAEEDARSACEREEDRCRMCLMIEMETVGSLIQKRFQEKLRKKISKLMPAYNEGRRGIMEEEGVQLAEILDWFKKRRPFGMRLPAFLGGERRLLQPKKPTKWHSANRGGRGRASALRRAMNSCGLESWPDAFPEASYLEEGRRAWAEMKLVRYNQRKEVSSTKEVEELEEAARENILAEETTVWLPIMALAVDEYYDAKRQTQEREKSELVALEENLEELRKREAIFARLEEEAEATAINEERATLKHLRAREGKEWQQIKTNDSSTASEVADAHPCETDPHPQPVPLEEMSSSWDSESNDTPMYPMLNVVLGIALERDSYAGVRNPDFSALGKAECVLAACEGRSPGGVAHAFSLAGNVPLCPAYLLHGLWHPPTPRGEERPKGAFDKSDVALHNLMEVEEEETEARLNLVKDQIVTVWNLYQQAAEEASRISTTKFGKVYYIGVNMPNDF